MRYPFCSVPAVFLCLVWSITAASAQSAADDDIHVSASTEFFALHKYPRQKQHKAIATGPQGFWATYYGGDTAARAARGALDQCNRILRTSKFKSQRSKKCILFDVDGKRTGKAIPVGIPFGTVAAGNDLPWQFGKEWNATASTRRGTMLLLHGCNGADFSNGWQMAWVNYYRAQGFRVIMPNSFADVRDPDSCPPLSENGVDKQTRNLKLRVAQTLRTLSGIRKKYPGEPLYLHGHSEGGAVAQALGEKVDGIIVTGATCGFGYSDFYHVGKGVPVLVIAGTKDPWFTQAKDAKGLAQFCRNIIGDGPMTLVSVAGMDHYAAIWWPPVEAAISKFLKVPSIRIGRPSVGDVTYPKLPSSDMPRYEKASQHKAIAANKSGAWSWNTEASSKLDAEENALFGCDNAAGADVFLDTSHIHNCMLVNVDGERLVK